jgi:hypothetical protein
MKPAPTSPRARRATLTIGLALCLAVSLAACAAATRPAAPGAPRANEEAPYPVLLELPNEQRDRAVANWAALLVGEARPEAVPPPVLQPVTATVAEIPPLAGARLQLPKVIIEGQRDPSAGPTDEELRESLRRFLTSAAPLVGAEPRELSLVEITNAPNGARRALYEQKPFSFPLRNGYGVVSVTFTPDLNVTALSSTALPENDRARRALNALTAQLSAQDAVAALAGKAVTYTDGAGSPQTRTIASTEGVTAREMVVYPRAAPASAARQVELRLAWEIAAGGTGTPLLVYVDAVTGDLLGATASSLNEPTTGDQTSARLLTKARASL